MFNISSALRVQLHFTSNSLWRHVFMWSLCVLRSGCGLYLLSCVCMNCCVTLDDCVCYWHVTEHQISTRMTSDPSTYMMMTHPPDHSTAKHTHRCFLSFFKGTVQPKMSSCQMTSALNSNWTEFWFISDSRTNHSVNCLIGSFMIHSKSQVRSPTEEKINT